MRARPLLAIAASSIALACHPMDYTPRHAEGEIDIYDDLFAVSVADTGHAVAVGYHGAAYWTEDGGETWHKGDTGTHDLLYSVSLANGRDGWAVGQLGTILRTSDGGRSWQRQANLKADEGAHLFGVHAVDSDTALAVGEWGTRIHTSDGGASWIDDSLTIDSQHPMFVWLTLQDQERVRRGEKVYEDVGLNDVTCLDPPSRSCWIIGEFGYVFRSEDRGRSWERGEIVGDVSMDPIRFGFNEIRIGESDQRALREFAREIEDATHLNVLLDPFVTRRELEAFSEPEDLFDLISARLDETKALLEEAGVLSDRMRIPAKPPWDYEDFLEDDETFLDRYFESRLGESPMVRVSVIQNPYLFTVDFRDERSGLIAGLGGVILRSADGGRSWRYEPIDRKQALFAVAAVDGRAIAVGEKGLVRVSDDGGATWIAPQAESFPPIFTFMRDLDFEHAGRLGLIVGQQGTVLRSRDGGRWWRRVLPPGDDLGVGRLL